MQNALDEATDPWGVKVIKNDDHITFKRAQETPNGSLHVCKKEPVYICARNFTLRGDYKHSSKIATKRTLRMI